MREYRPYILPDGTEIPGYWFQNPERFVATEYGWRKLRTWAIDWTMMCQRSDADDPTTWHPGHEFHHTHGRGGGKRDDRLESMEWLCRPCHETTPILRRKHNVEESPSPVVPAQPERI
jgi:hypothetical protein